MVDNTYCRVRLNATLQVKITICIVMFLQLKYIISVS